jgi:predicted nucleic-acid-binding Zn-ribbon protein
MKENHECPKCKGRRMWIIDQLTLCLNTGATYLDTAVPVALIKRSKWTLGKTMGTFQLYVCAACGYTEMFAVGIDALQPNPDLGIHLFDGEPKPGTEGPMR